VALYGALGLDHPDDRGGLRNLALGPGLLDQYEAGLRYVLGRVIRVPVHIR